MNSQEKYNQKQQDKLESYRFKFAGQKIVCCATSADVNVADYFDFTNIKPEEINFGVHGDQYIKAKARNKHTGEIKDCFLKWVNREAAIVSYKDNDNSTFDKSGNFKSDIPGDIAFYDFAKKEFDVKQISGYAEKFEEALIAHINSGLYKKEDLKPEHFKIEGRNIEFSSNDRSHFFNLDEMKKLSDDYISLKGKEKTEHVGNVDLLFEDSHLEVSYEEGFVVLKDQKGEVLERININGIFENDFERYVTEYLNGLRDMLIEKNKSYGNSALDPVRVFSTADSEEQIKVRIDDKLSRIQRGNNSFNEDTIKDLIGYLVLLQYKKSQE